MEIKCDMCEETKGIQCEILTKGEDVDRVYHLCPNHWVEVYRRTLDDFVENNEYKANSYIKMVADKMIVDAQHEAKMKEYVDEEGILDIDALDPVEIRQIRPYGNPPESE